MNNFLLTGNELVADWPEPKRNDFKGFKDYYTAIHSFNNRPRYTCTKELLAMLKEGERYELNKDFETHPCSCDRRMDNHTDCGKPGKNRTPQCFIAMPVYTGESVEKGEGLQSFIEAKYDVFFGKGYWEDQYKAHIVEFAKQCVNENDSVKHQLSKH